MLDAQLAYWREQLAGAPPVLELPDRPAAAGRRRAAAARSASPGARRPAHSQRSGRSRRQRGARSFMTLLAGFQALLRALLAGRTTWWSARRSPTAPGSRSRG